MVKNKPNQMLLKRSMSKTSHSKGSIFSQVLWSGRTAGSHLLNLPSELIRMTPGGQGDIIINIKETSIKSEKQWTKYLQAWPIFQPNFFSTRRIIALLDICRGERYNKIKKHEFSSAIKSEYFTNQWSLLVKKKKQT